MPKALRPKSRARLSVFGGRIPAKLPVSLEAHHISEGVKKALEAKGVAITIIPLMDGARPRVKKEKKVKK